MSKGRNLTRKPVLTQEVKRGPRKLELEADKSSYGFSLGQAKQLDTVSSSVASSLPASFLPSVLSSIVETHKQVVMFSCRNCVMFDRNILHSN